jgi:dihydroorotase
VSLGNRIKWNPSVKTAADREGLYSALQAGNIDFIATDHAPHLIAEKQGNCFSSLSGGPLVQHAIPALTDLMHQGKLSLEDIAQYTAHNVAEAYRVKERGYIREGYFADLIIVDPKKKEKVSKKRLLYKCGWSPFEGKFLRGAVTGTFVNGRLMYYHGKFNDFTPGNRLLFSRLL